MKHIITIRKIDFPQEALLKDQIESMVKKFETKEAVEFQPKNKKAAEVIRLLRDNSIHYQIRFESESRC
jgi:hypothetical protein